MTDYPVGGFFVTPVSDWGGKAIALGELLAGASVRDIQYGHCGIITDADGTTVEAQPEGARRGSVADYPWAKVCDGPVQRYLASPLREGDEDQIRARIADEARKLIGTPYSWLDYFALALLHLHLPARWVRQRVEDSGHLICSALCDRAYMNAGIHLFTDRPGAKHKRLCGDVMPADLAAWADQWEQQQASLAVPA